MSAAELAGRAYRIGLVAFAVPAVTAVILAFRASVLWGMTALVVAAVELAVVTIALQLGLKAVVAVFRIADYAGEIAEQEAQIALNTATPGKLDTPTKEPA